MDLKTGALEDLLVTPQEGINPTEHGLETNDRGRIRLSVGAVQAVKDYIVVAR